MAQVTITHFMEKTPTQIIAWCEFTEKVTAEVIYHRGTPQPGDVTVRTQVVDRTGSSSDAQTELHVEIAESNWPRDTKGFEYAVDDATKYFNEMAHKISKKISKSIDQTGSFNVWVTPYRATGWATYNGDGV